MSFKVGVWIDHEKALLVSLSGENERLTRIESNVEKHTRAGGGARSSSSNGPQDVVAEDKVQRRFEEHLKVFYKAVIKSLEGADSILILGPGEAKIEFQKQFKSKSQQQSIVDVLTCDKLTDHQLVAKVNDYFQAKPVS